MRVTQPGIISVTANQTDLRIQLKNILKKDKKKKPSEIANKLRYDTVRMTIGQITEEGFIFKDCRYDREKVITLQAAMDQGNYVILVEFFMEKKQLNGNEFRLNGYSDSEELVLAKIYDEDDVFFRKVELEFWRNKVLRDSDNKQNNFISKKFDQSEQ